VSNTKFDAKFLVLNEFGNPVRGAEVQLHLTYKAWGSTQFPSPAFPKLTQDTSFASAQGKIISYTNEQGVASFQGLMVKKINPN